MFSVLNKYNLLQKASYQEKKRLSYFKKKKSKSLRQEHPTHTHKVNRLPNRRDPTSNKIMHLVTAITDFLLDSNLESMYLTYSL